MQSVARRRCSTGQIPPARPPWRRASLSGNERLCSDDLFRALDVRANAAKSAVAFLVLDHGAQEISARKVRPQSVRHVQLGVRDLPEEKIADAHLTRGPNQQIRIRAM